MTIIRTKDIKQLHYARTSTKDITSQSMQGASVPAPVVTRVFLVFGFWAACHQTIYTAGQCSANHRLGKL